MATCFVNTVKAKELVKYMWKSFSRAVDATIGKLACTAAHDQSSKIDRKSTLSHIMTAL